MNLSELETRRRQIRQPKSEIGLLLSALFSARPFVSD